MTKASGATKKKRRVYIYCRTYRTDADADALSWDRSRPEEVRRYTVRKELKRDIHLHPGHAVRRDGKWHQVDSEPLTIWKYKGTARIWSARIEEGLHYLSGQFERGLPRWWPEGKPEPPKQEKESAFRPTFPILEEMFAGWMKSTGYVRPDWAAFGFDCKPSEAEFKKSHRKQSRNLHPDHGGDAGEFATMQAKAERCLTCFKKAEVAS